MAHDGECRGECGDWMVGNALIKKKWQTTKGGISVCCLGEATSLSYTGILMSAMQHAVENAATGFTGCLPTTGSCL